MKNRPRWELRALNAWPRSTPSSSRSGRQYKTLSAIATQIAGSRWNGFLFFGLKKRGDAASEESAA